MTEPLIRAEHDGTRRLPLRGGGPPWWAVLLTHGVRRIGRAVRVDVSQGRSVPSGGPRLNARGLLTEELLLKPAGLLHLKQARPSVTADSREPTRGIQQTHTQPPCRERERERGLAYRKLFKSTCTKPVPTCALHDPFTCFLSSERIQAQLGASAFKVVRI